MKKILTLLALMVATVAVVATGYKLTRPAKAAGDVTSYTDKLVINLQWSGSGTNDQGKLEVTDNGNGTYNFTIPAQTLGDLNIASAMNLNNIAGTEDANGYVVYDGT